MPQRYNNEIFAFASEFFSLQWALRKIYCSPWLERKGITVYPTLSGLERMAKYQKWFMEIRVHFLLWNKYNFLNIKLIYMYESQNGCIVSEVPSGCTSPWCLWLGLWPSGFLPWSSSSCTKLNRLSYWVRLICDLVCLFIFHPYGSMCLVTEWWRQWVKEKQS